MDGPKVWLVSDKVTEHFEQFNSSFDQTCKAFKMLKVFDGFDRLLLKMLKAERNQEMERGTYPQPHHGHVFHCCLPGSHQATMKYVATII